MSKSHGNESVPASEGDKLQVCGTIPKWIAEKFRELGGDRSRLVAGAVYSYICMKANLQRRFEGEALGELASQQEAWEKMYLGVELRLLGLPHSPPEETDPKKKK